GVFGDSQFTSTLSVNFHFPKIPRRTFFYGCAPRADGMGDPLAGPCLRRYRQGGARRERIRIRHPGVTRGLSEPILSGKKLKVGYKINDSLVINDELRHIHRHYLRIRGDKP
ncbi:hypothetical protein ACK3YT_19830, partial [Aeromonas caviae]